MLDRVARRLRQLTAGARVKVAREQVAQIRSLTGQIDALKRELRVLVEAHRLELLAEVGCGELTAALLIGRTAGAERFKSDASFALQSGSAPIPCSSGQRTQYRLNRGGDRQLNHALHVIAITRAHHDPLPRSTSLAKSARAKPRRARCAASNATSPDAFTESSPSQPSTHKTPTTRPGKSRLTFAKLTGRNVEPVTAKLTGRNVEPVTAAPCPMPASPSSTSRLPPPTPNPGAVLRLPYRPR